MFSPLTEEFKYIPLCPIVNSLLSPATESANTLVFVIPNTSISDIPTNPLRAAYNHLLLYGITVSIAPNPIPENDISFALLRANEVALNASRELPLRSGK